MENNRDNTDKYTQIYNIEYEYNMIDRIAKQ